MKFAHVVSLISAGCFHRVLFTSLFEHISCYLKSSFQNIFLFNHDETAGVVKTSVLSELKRRASYYSYVIKCIYVLRDNVDVYI